MLCEKINLLMNLLNAGCADIARLTNHSATSFSRLRSGSRVPKPNSPTIRHFTEGILLFASETNQIDKLCMLIQCSSDENLTNSMTDWLYSGQIPETIKDHANRTAKFSGKLDMLMKLAEMNNGSLANASEIEYSYISRLHRGERFPKSGSESLKRICDALFSRMEKDGKLSALAEQTAIPPENLSASVMRDWLCGFTDNIDLVSVRRFIGSIEKMTAEPQKISEISVIPDDSIAEYYLGSEGLRNAVTRFLSSVQKGQEILLYSDHPMDWMTGSYQSQWAALMFRCLQMGVHIRIIHNVDRNIPEMLTAIQSWLPLYLSGRIEPFYSLKQRGERFCHTLFLCPDHAAVWGCSPDGAECEYAYVTNSDRLHHLENEFSLLLENCRPLLSVDTKPQYPDGDALSRRFGNAEVLADKNSVIVNKLSAPYLSFRFLYPEIIRAFRSLLNG